MRGARNRTVSGPDPCTLRHLTRHPKRSSEQQALRPQRPRGEGENCKNKTTGRISSTRKGYWQTVLTECNYVLTICRRFGPWKHPRNQCEAFSLFRLAQILTDRRGSGSFGFDRARGS